jgi:glycosyltransferase involved in cell wall biosynthesis
VPSGVRGFLQSRLPELSLIIVSRPHNMRYLKASCGSDVAHQVPVIYDAEAVAALREVRRRQLNDSVSSANARQLIDEEVRLARGCHAVLVVNATEQRHFQDAGVPNVTILSHALAPSPTPAPFDRRQGMLFVGAFDPSSPNEDSANVLIDEILPAVNEIARRSVPLVLAGANMPPRLRSLRREGVSTFANVPDLAPLYNEARVFVAPTRYSAGIPLKILEAAAFGLPVVCSAMLADQLGWQPRVELLVADSAEEFAGAVVAVHENETRWSQLRAAGLRRIATDCSIEQFRRVAADVVEAVLNGEVIAATPRPSSPLPLT